VRCHTRPSFEVEQREAHLSFIDGGNDAFAEIRASNSIIDAAIQKLF
jgi:hypothetical protein